MSDHPHYRNPTIQEALCEFRLKPSPNATWNPKKPGEILRSLGIDNFPGMEPLNELNFELSIDASGHPQQRIVQGPQKIRYSSDDGTRMVQVSPNMYCFNSIGKYPGWEEMKKQIISNWHTVQPFVLPERFERVGLRYINRIPFRGGEQPISDWIKPNKHIPDGIIDCIDGITYRFEERRFTKNDVIIVTIVTQSLSANDRHLLFDIDRSHSLQSLPNENNLRSLIEKLHEDVWDVFDSAKTETLYSYLNRSTDNDT